MKRTFLFFILMLAASSLAAQQHIHFRTDAPQGFSIEKSTAVGLSLQYSVGEIGIVDIDNGEAKGQEIVLKGSFGSFAQGSPNLPFENQYIAVPKGATVHIEIKEKATQTLSGIDLLPAAPVQKNTDRGLPELQKDMSIYGKDAYFPSESVSIAQTTQIRGLDVVLLSVTPFRYNPIRKVLEVIYDMDIEIRFEGGNGQFGESRYRNPDWDGILRNLIINSNMLPEAHYYDLLNEAVRNREESCEYLIIAPDDEDILAWADTLKQFRTKQGILTKVVTPTECGGNDANTIKGYIQNAYEHWSIPPAALMIFGGLTDTLLHSWPVEIYAEGTDGIPGFPLVFLNYNDEGGVNYYKSDNPYADMNGDSIPDIAISRLTAKSLSEYQIQVSKLIQYETTPPDDFPYYDQPIITSGHEDNKWFLLTSQATNGFYLNKLGKHPKNFYMLYDYYYYVPMPDTLWSTGYNTAAVVDYFGPKGQNYFPRYPNQLNDWRNMVDNSYFVDALNQSSFLTLYRDHCAKDWWCCPIFETQDITYLSNTKPTFILSIGCNTAQYTQSYHHGSLKLPCLISSFCNSDVGALGGIGAASVTHSHFNDILTWGFLDYIWPEFMPNLGCTTEPYFVRPSFGLVAGKLFLNQHAFMPNWWAQKIIDTHNVFHYLGEAYLNLYTEVPQSLELEAPLQHPNAQWYYRFTAEEGATVCFSKNGEILHVVSATGQPQTIQLPEMAMGEQFTITVTKQNRFRKEQIVTITESGNEIPEQSDIDFKIFPNPTSGKVNLVIGETQQGKTVVEVYNLLGERMMVKNISNLQKGENYSLDLSHLVSGLYIIKLNTESGSCSKKVSVW